MLSLEAIKQANAIIESLIGSIEFTRTALTVDILASIPDYAYGPTLDKLNHCRFLLDILVSDLTDSYIDKSELPF